MSADYDESESEDFFEPDNYVVANPHVKVELAFLKLIPIWLNLNLLGVMPDLSLDPASPERKEQHARQRELYQAYLGVTQLVSKRPVPPIAVRP